MAAIEDEEAQECIINDGVVVRLEFFSNSPLHFLVFCNGKRLSESYWVLFRNFLWLLSDISFY